MTGAGKGAGKIAAHMGRKALMWLPALILAAGTGALLPLGTAAASTSWTHGGHTLTVATHGADQGNCRWRPCRTLGYALTQAGPNDTIVIHPGTYRESGNANVVTPGLTGLSIRSTRWGRTVINAAGNANGILIQASGVSVTGLTVKNANLEGILAEPPLSSWPTGPTSPPAGISHVTIAGNVVVHNDQAYEVNGPPMAECPLSKTDADDCGEGIHLLGVSWSKVIGNNVSHNVGGILVSDGGFGISVGPAAHNLIAYNRSTDNLFDCGITLPGHDPRAVAQPPASNAGQPQPNLAGVYDNVVIHNVSNGNGAAGLLDAAPYPGAASYDNLFADNSASGNGNSGFVLHSHAPFQDVSGIVVVGNRFGPNNLAGDPDTGVTSSTGVMLLSVAVPTKIVVAGNKIFNNVNGVAFNSLITHVGHNRFAHVTNRYFLYVPPA
jgi:Right handed beta helix region